MKSKKIKNKKRAVVYTQIIDDSYLVKAVFGGGSKKW